MKKLIITITLVICAPLAHSDQNLISLFPINHYNQSVDYWINPTQAGYDTAILNNKTAQQHFDLFYQHYFGSTSPWNATYVNDILQQTSPSTLKSEEAKTIAFFDNENKSEDEINYGANFHPYDKAWIDAIRYNMNLTQFDPLSYQASQRAIAIDNAYARALPTNDPCFYSFNLPGQGYPFDNLQMSALWAGTPVYVVTETRDHAWSFVITPDYIAWVKSTSIAYVDDQFVNTWTLTAKKQLAAITKTQTTVMTTNGRYLFSAYIGTVLPVERHDTTIEALVPVADDQQHAVIGHASLSTDDASLMPLATTPHQFATLIHHLIGRPYGWGNLNFYNDCSAELKNLLAPFGIWLPRHSSYQVKIGKMVDMSSSSAEERLQYLKENGQRFLTIVYIGGHVFLYAGNADGNVMTYQNIWGLRPNPPDRRAVIGQSVFLPLLLQYPEDPSLVSLADKKYFQVAYLNDLSQKRFFFFPKLKKGIDLRSLIFPAE